MSRGLSWSEKKSDALIKPWLIEVNNPIGGTGQSGKEFWRRALQGWLQLLRGKLGAASREHRGFDSLRKKWAKIVAGVMDFSSCMAQARQSKLSGVASHADIVNFAEGLFCSQNIYSRIRGDHADDVNKGKTTKRRKKMVSCPWARYWNKLKYQDLIMSAAASFAAVQKKAATKQVQSAKRAAAAASADGSEDAAEQQAAGGDTAPAAVASAVAGNAGVGAAQVLDVDDTDDELWGGRPVNTKAAKRLRAEPIADYRTIGREASAVEKLEETAEQRTVMMAVSQLSMRKSQMGVAYWAYQAKKMIEKKGIKVPGDAAAAARWAGSAVDDAAGTGSPPVGAAAGEAPVDDGSASRPTAAAKHMRVIAIDDDPDVSLVACADTPSQISTVRAMMAGTASRAGRCSHIGSCRCCSGGRVDGIGVGGRICNLQAGDHSVGGSRCIFAGAGAHNPRGRTSGDSSGCRRRSSNGRGHKAGGLGHARPPLDDNQGAQRHHCSARG
eukprot:TRINITY_DN2547_c0_g1_i1.p1 TRINITY_DN2547_c0_g1~~TRINITY_DN2547_c0_g1_i1.p1  ORF type:complete len:498 (-),score=99.83 TRINITY_DN2547_c0_g1_i1:70-1563(-)